MGQSTWGATQNSDDGPQLEERELCSYAALILADAGEDVTADNMNKLISAAGANVPSYYVQIFEKVAGMRSPKEMVEDAGKVGSGAPGGAAPAAGSGSAPASAAKKESSSESEGADMAGGGLFGEEEAW